MSKREELIKEIRDRHQYGVVGIFDEQVVADFILQREKALLDQIEGPLKYAEEKMSVVDCGDNSCAFVRPKKGMRTNGGCRCFKDGVWNTESRIAIQVMPVAIRKALEAISKLRGEG